MRWITEIAVTDRRVIYKRGFITRHTVEMNMDKVASVDVDQSILGRMLDYGTVHVSGLAASKTTNADVVRGIEHLHRSRRRWRCAARSRRSIEQASTHATNDARIGRSARRAGSSA